MQPEIAHTGIDERSFWTLGCSKLPVASGVVDRRQRVCILDWKNNLSSRREVKILTCGYVVFPFQTVSSERWKRVIKYIFKKLERILENRSKGWRMLEDNEISDYFRSNFHRLQNAITPQDMKKFISLNSNSERIDFMLRYPQVYDLAIKIGEVEDQMLKNGEKALKLKDVGNKYFGRGEFIKALEIYSNAVLLAPQKGN